MPSEAFATDTPLAPEFAQLEEQFEEFEGEVLEFAAPLSDQQLLWRPAAKGWSIAECLDHLNVAGFELLPRLDRAIADTRRLSLRREEPFKPRWRASLFARMMEPPSRLRAKAPEIFLPRWPEEPRKVVRELVDLQGELIKRLREADGLDLSAAQITSPAARWIKFSLGEWLVVTAAHQRRHLHQARLVLADSAFPSAGL